jgi:CheY-like chemotaxis protein
MQEYSVLIIDDDIWMQRILSKTLQNYGFVKTYLASNGFDGIALAVEHQPTLIVLDIMMPELTGLITLKILKHIKLTRDIPVIIVSALSDVENLGKAVKSGTAGFISKPFTRATVYDKLVDVFGKRKLDKIARGEPIDDMNMFDEQYQDLADKEILEDTSDTYKESLEINTDEEAISEEKQADASDNQGLLKTYKEDEKRSIEAIKKMLLKNRK